MEHLHYDYLPEATRIPAEEIEHLTHCKALFRGLLRQVYEDGRQAAFKEMRKQQREIDDYESRNPRL